MMDRPDQATLLEAVAAYLEKDARPQIADPGVAFRALIAANLCRIVAAESRAGERFELESLRVAASILGQAAPSADTQAERRALLVRLEAELASKLKSHELPLGPSTVEALMQLLATELAIVSPRFDRALHLERSE